MPRKRRTPRPGSEIPGSSGTPGSSTGSSTPTGSESGRPQDAAASAARIERDFPGTQRPPPASSGVQTSNSGQRPVGVGPSNVVPPAINYLAGDPRQGQQTGARTANAWNSPLTFGRGSSPVNTGFPRSDGNQGRGRGLGPAPHLGGPRQGPPAFNYPAGVPGQVRQWMGVSDQNSWASQQTVGRGSKGPVRRGLPRSEGYQGRRPAPDLGEPSHSGHRPFGVGASNAVENVRDPSMPELEPDEERGGSEGNPGGTPENYHDGDARDPGGSSAAPIEFNVGSEADALTRFVRTRLVNCLVVSRGNNPEQEFAKIVKDLRPYLEHASGVRTIFPEKPNELNNQAIANQDQGRKVYANYFKVNWAPNHHEFSVYKASWSGQIYTRTEKIEAWTNIVLDRYFADYNPRPNYDGNSCVVSVQPFTTFSLADTQKLKSAAGLTLPVLENRISINFKSKMTLHMVDLDNYLNAADDHQRYVRFPQDIIRFVNNIMKDYCRMENYIESGRYFFLRDVHEDQRTINENLRADWGQILQRRQGYFHSVRVVEVGLALNVDFLSTAFYRPGKALKKIWQAVASELSHEDRGFFEIDEVTGNPDFHENRITEQQVRIASGYLKNLKIASSHRIAIDRVKRDCCIFEVENTPARDMNVTLNRTVGAYQNGSQIPLVQLLRDQNGYRLPPEVNLEEIYPALKVSKRNNYYLPWGCCTTTESSRFTGKLEGKFLKLLQRDITNRHENIIKFISTDREATGTELYTELNVEPELLEVTPLRFYPKVMFPRPNERYRVPATVGTWAKLSFNHRDNERTDNGFQQTEARYIHSLRRLADRKGMRWEAEPSFAGYFNSVPHRAHAQTRTDLVYYVNDFMQKFGPFNFLLCFMSRRMHPEYATLKFLCDQTHGVASQVIIIRRGEEPNERKLLNLLLKINVKCNGKNFIFPQEEMTRLERNMGLNGVNTILMGADVFHPKTSDDSYSVAAVVATIDNTKISYACRLKALDRNDEMMRDGLTDMVKELLEVYRANVGQYPQNILFFRDGLSESQYLTCLRVEGTAILKAVRETGDNYSADVAIILAMKRHHTRFFVFCNPDQPGLATNLEEGHVVHKGVTNLKDYDFFLCSHQSAKGTTRPTHYLVLLDQIGIQPRAFYEYVYNLCRTFQRCSLGVSLVTPIYYAHLAAARAKLYMQNYVLEYTNQPFPAREDPRISLNAHINLKNRLWFV